MKTLDERAEPREIRFHFSSPVIDVFLIFFYATHNVDAESKYHTKLEP